MCDTRYNVVMRIIPYWLRIKKKKKINNNVWNFIAPLRKSLIIFSCKINDSVFILCGFGFVSPLSIILNFGFFVSLLPSICMRKEEEGNQEKIDTTSIVICTWFSVKCCQQMVPRIFFSLFFPNWNPLKKLKWHLLTVLLCILLLEITTKIQGTRKSDLLWNHILIDFLRSRKRLFIRFLENFIALK